MVNNFKLNVVFLLLFSCCAIVSIAQSKYPSNIEAVLKKTPTNRKELEKALDYYSKPKDSLKLKAMQFLIANMDTHGSKNYYWADSIGKRLPFNELDYPDFDSSVWAFEKLKLVTPKIHPITYAYKDIDSIKASFLINNVEYAFNAWQKPWAKSLSFDDFCEFLLPYRTSIEPFQDWREVYSKKFASLADTIYNLPKNLQVEFIEQTCKGLFKNTFSTEKRNDPIPRLGALQLIHRNKGACEDEADFTVFVMRSLGIPATVDFVPQWGTSTFFHFLAGVPKSFMSKLHENSDSVNNNPYLKREPSKVIRTTFAYQPNTLAAWQNKDSIPEGFLRTTNYVDVTNHYWPTVDVTTELFSPKNAPLIKTEENNVVYACVFNGLAWRVIWWGKVINNNVLFTKMSKGVVYLPMRYKKNFLIPAGFPVAVGYNHQLILTPDTIHKHDVILQEQERYLKYRPEKKYTLYYWGNRWIKISEQMAKADTKQLIFQNVPQNALLLLVPEYSQRKERPFMITNDGQRIWW